MSFVEELRAALARIQDDLRTAQHQVDTAAELLATSHTAFVDAGADHPSSLVPPQLLLAREQLDLLGSRLAALHALLAEYGLRL